MFFFSTHWPQLMALFYSILFKPPFASLTAQFCPIMHDETREHLTRSETIPSSRMTPDTLDSQLHVGGASLVHLTHFLQGSGQRTGMAIAEALFCAP